MATLADTVGNWLSQHQQGIADRLRAQGPAMTPQGNLSPFMMNMLNNYLGMTGGGLTTEGGGGEIPKGLKGIFEGQGAPDPQVPGDLKRTLRGTLSDLSEWDPWAPREPTPKYKAYLDNLEGRRQIWHGVNGNRDVLRLFQKELAEGISDPRRLAKVNRIMAKINQKMAHSRAIAPLFGVDVDGPFPRDEWLNDMMEGRITREDMWLPKKDPGQ
jgi:hypothetical protein